MQGEFENFLGIILMLVGLLSAISPLRLEKFEFHPYMEHDYWTRVLRTHKRVFRYGSLLIAFGFGMLTAEVIDGYRPTLLHFGHFLFATGLFIGIRFRSLRIEQLLEREASRKGTRAPEVTRNANLTQPESTQS